MEADVAKLIVFNKPFQVLSQFTDEGERRTLSDFIDVKAVYPAGRLDYDSEGFLLGTGGGRSDPKALQGANVRGQLKGR
jgi:23S rRNA pseudouridine2457 synthase